MEIHRIVTNALAVNCYVISSDYQGIIVDPGEQSQAVIEYCQAHNLEIVAIVNTHGHADHIAGNAWFMEQLSAPLYIHEEDVPYLSSPDLNLATLIRQDIPATVPTRLLQDGDTIEIGNKKLEVLHTPGHTPGGISLYYPEMVVTGDALFRGSVGRTDLPGSDPQKLIQSLIRLGRLPLETVVYPGHGEPSTIAHEIAHNPHM